MKSITCSMLVVLALAAGVVVSAQIPQIEIPVIRLTPIPPEYKLLGSIDFGKYQPQSWYTLDQMSADWSPRKFNGDDPIDFKGIGQGRAMIVKADAFGGNALRVLLPKGKILPADTGIQIFGFLLGQETIYFSASIYLPPDFECGKEIKIPPGIYGGWKFASGGIRPDGDIIGPSVRAVLQDCRAKSYVYHLNQVGNNDDGSDFRTRFNGDKFSWMFPDGKPVVMTKGVVHNITFYVAMNTVGKPDGVHRVFYDGVQVLALENLQFRRVDSLKFDTIGVEIFRGGSDESYAAATDNALDVGKFRVYVKK
jgi:hypothetical protein